MKEQANRMLLDCGIIETLSMYGEMYIHGSYEMDLMVWPELDIYLSIHNFQTIQIFKILDALHRCSPIKQILMFNQVDHQNCHGPKKAILIDLTIHHAGLDWKMDLAVGDTEHFGWVKNYNQRVKAKMTPALHQVLLEIKKQAVEHPMYKRQNWKLLTQHEYFYSHDLYEAVLLYGVKTYPEFLSHIKTNKLVDSV